MKLELTNDRCVGHGQCYAKAPELFEPDDEGYSRLKVEGDVPPDLEAAARAAANSCPEYAIALIE
jgi:ferredoxin